MQINNRRKKNKQQIIIIVIIILLLLGGGAFFYWFSLTQSDNNHLNDKTNDNSKTKIDNDSKNETNNENEKTINDPQQNTVASSPEINGFLTSKNISDSALILRVQINELLPNGTCSLILSNGANIVTKNSDLINSATSSSCYGFDVPLAELSNGTWQIKITIQSGDRTGIITDEVMI